jgi:hypothetical protein
MQSDLDAIERFEPTELSKELLDQVSGGLLPDFDPDG